MKKKLLALVLVFAMALSLAACGDKKNEAPKEDEGTTVGTEGDTATDDTTGDDTTGDDATGDEDTTGDDTTSSGATDMDTLVVGTTEMNGDFINDFGNSSYDAYIKDILHGFTETYHQTDAGEFALSDKTVVQDLQTEEDADGNKIYTFTLFDDMKWSNGDPITAKDYVAAVLFKASPEWVAAGASSTTGQGLLGYSAYLNGETTDFAGIKLIDEYVFSLTIDGKELPYFYEVVYAQVSPIYMPTYVPDATVVSDDNGSHFEFASGDLKTACEKIAAGERFAPTVTCGPYRFVSYENQIVTLEKNEHFKGDYDGEKPKLQYVVQKAVPQDTDVDQVIAGELDLVTGEVEGKKIEAAKAAGNAILHSYFRSGYGMIALACDFGPTKDANVRWALASLIDRAAVIDYVLGGYGGTVDAEYGTAQWTYQERTEELNEALKPLTFNVDTANDYLDQSEYKFESDGTTPFDRNKAAADGSYLRHNAAGEPLIIEHFGTDENSVTDIIEIQYTANAPLAGVKFNVTKGDFNVLLDSYYYGYEMDESERTYCSFNLATNFTAWDDKYQSNHSDYLKTWYNANQISDEKLDELIMAMRNLDPTQTEEYADAWVLYQQRWQELMPCIPLYSNEYFDIANEVVDNLVTTPYATYANTICKLSKSAK